MTIERDITHPVCSGGSALATLQAAESRLVVMRVGCKATTSSGEMIKTKQKTVRVEPIPGGSMTEEGSSKVNRWRARCSPQV